MRPKFTLYVRIGCSLCENLWHEVEALPERERFELETVDVDTDPELARRYGDKVPLLFTPAGELCRYFLDPDAVHRYFESL